MRFRGLTFLALKTLTTKKSLFTNFLFSIFEKMKNNLIRI
jgi:hypothetical protein